MATCKDCKDCIHYELCGVFDYISPDECGFYTDRSRFVELPCKVGDTLYTLVTGSRIREWIVTDITFSSYSIVEMVITADSKDNDGTDHMKFGKHYLNHTVFLSRAAAEQALKERERNAGRNDT